MWIGLLGPLLITSHDQPVRVPAAKQRSLLAALAIHAGDVVPVDALAEAIWGATLPHTWQSTLRNYVKRLRDVLGWDAGSRIRTVPPGYLIEAGADEVDLLVFEELAKTGFAAASIGDWALASAKLTAADALWRGTPFVDIPSRHVRDEQVPYLEERRLAALEARIEADVRLSVLAAAEVIPDLRRFTARYPERERLRSLLMLALYRSGRPADALAVYREAWQFSVIELGLEPGQDMQVLHQRILTADPSLLNGPPNHWSAAVGEVFGRRDRGSNAASPSAR